MTLRTKTTQLAAIALLGGMVVSGCRPQVDYSPKTATPSAAPRNAGTGEKTASIVDAEAEPGKKAPVDSGAIDLPARKQLPELIAYDEFDGVHRDGWKEYGLGEWSGVAEERNGALVVAGDADAFRALAKPVKDEIVWLAVTMRMETPVTGFASVDGSNGPPKRYSKMGFSALEKPFTSQGFWLDPDRGTKIENTDLQTFLTRFSFTAHNADGYAARDYGFAMVDADGMMFVRPRVRMSGSFMADRLSHLSLKKSGPEKLIVERVAIARTPAAALVPQIPAVARRPGPPDQPVPAKKPDTAGSEQKPETPAPAPVTGETKPEGSTPQPPASNTPTGAENAPQKSS